MTTSSGSRSPPSSTMPRSGGSEPFPLPRGHTAMATALSEPLTRLILSAGFLGATLVPFAKICLGC